MNETIQLEDHDRVRLIRFNRPAQLNAMSSQMIEEIITAIEAADADERVGAVVLTGAGKAFMAGADIKEYAQLDDAGFRLFQRRGGQIYAAIERAGIPVLAAINGYALGGGFEIALACDGIVARRDARLGLPEIKLGLIPGGGGTQRLTRKIGPNKAFELLATGRHHSADLYAELGLVNELTDENPSARAIELGEEMACQSPAALAALKSLVRLAGEASLGAGIDAEAGHLISLFETSNARDQIAAFARKSEIRARKG